MQIDESRLDRLIVLRPVGRLDNVTSADFQARLLHVIASADVIIDLGSVEYISSGGLRALMMAAKQRPTHRIGVAGMHPLVQEVFAISHFEQLIPVFASIEEARQAWAEPPASDRGGR